MSDTYEVILDGGGPWGIRLQGGKDFGVPLNVARVTPGSKAAIKGILAGDSIVSINGVSTDSLSHMDAQNAIKQSGQRLGLLMRKGKGVSLGEIKQVGGGGFAAAPSKTLYTTDVTHSAGVDHKYNSKPRAFGASPSGAQTTTTKKFNPAEYAKRKKEELEKYKEEQNKPSVPDSDVLRMLQNTKIQDNQPGGGSFSSLQDSLNNEGQWAEKEKAFRMTADGTDLSDVSPGSQRVVDDIKHYGSAGLTHSGAPSGGSRSFKVLQQLTDNEDLPPPPPEMMAGGSNEYGFDEGPKSQSGTFKRLQQMTDSGDGDQVRTVFDQPSGQRGQPVYAGQQFTPAPKNPSNYSGMPTGPNFKVGRAAAPSFKPSSYVAPKGPPPPAVNAGEVLNTNSKLYNTSGYPTGSPSASATSVGSGGYQPRSPTGTSPAVFNPAANKSPQPFTPASPPQAPAAAPAPVRSAAQPMKQQVAPQGGENELYCGACQQPLSGGPFVSAIGKTWHPDHFCCSSCSVSLQNQAFVEENNQLFCEKCYNSFYAPKCAHCNNAIIGNCINALGKSWHPDHFVCSFCNRGFGNEGFLVDSGKPYCEKCFEDLFSVKCGKCMRAITGGEKYVEALNKNWHSQCFTCNQCSSRLEGNSFFVSRGMPYCQNHKGGI